MADRKTLLTRGYYVPTDIETAFLGLSGRAHDVLILIKHKQGENSEAFPMQAWLARVLKTSLRSIQRAVAELVAKGAMKLRRTGRASRYKAVYGRCTIPQIRAMLHLTGGADTPPAGTSDPPPPGGSKEEEPEKKNQGKTPTSSLREEGDAAAPQTPREQKMPTQRQHRNDDQLDPVTALGLWDSQPSSLFPEPPRQPRGRSQAQQDAPYALACELDRLCSGQPWAGPSPVNRKALASNFSRWKKDGLSAEDIRQMMAAFTADGSAHHPSKPAWIDFLSRRRALYAQLQRAQQHQEMEEHRYDEAYWLGDLAGR